MRWFTIPLAGLTLLAGWSLMATGCIAPAAAPAPVPAAHFSQAWDAALEVLRDNGYRTAVADRDQGFIETAPEREGSWLDPWNIAPHQSGAEVTEALSARQRRIVRVWFFPAEVGSEPLPTATQLANPLVGVPGPGAIGQSRLLTSSPDQAVVVAWTAVIERQSQANQNPNPWSGSLETSWQSRVEVQQAPSPGMSPVVRDIDPWVPIRTDNEESMRLGRALLGRLPPA